LDELAIEFASATAFVAALEARIEKEKLISQVSLNRPLFIASKSLIEIFIYCSLLYD